MHVRHRHFTAVALLDLLLLPAERKRVLLVLQVHVPGNGVRRDHLQLDSWLFELRNRGCFILTMQ